MDLLRFNADDIHELRAEMFERWRNMPPEEAEKDFQIQAAEARKAIEKIRRAKARKTG